MSEAETFDALMHARWSCRAFKPDPVPRATIEAILETAQRTASWNNVQPWKVVITSGNATERLRTMLVERATSGAPSATHFPFPEAYEGIYKARRRACGFQLYDAVGIERGDKPAYARQTLRNFALFDAPHAAIVTSEKVLGTYGVLDCGAYVSNFMTAATAHGVATIAQGALAVQSDALHTHLGLPENRRIVCGIAFGYADMDHPVNGYRVDRAPLAEVVRWDDD